MTQENFGGMFLYRGNAQGLGASFFPTQAMCSLPTTGGTSEALVEDFHHRRHDVSFKRIYTAASGMYNHKLNAFETHVKAEVHGGRIGDLFRLDEGYVAVSSRHIIDKTEQLPVRTHFPDKLEFSFAGYRAQVTFHPDLTEVDTRDTLLERMRHDGFRKEHAHRFYRRDGMTDRQALCSANRDDVSVIQGYILYSPVAKVEWAGARESGNRVDGHVLISSKFGRCFIGETFRDDHSCRVNLFRFSLGATRDDGRSAFAASFAQGLAARAPSKGQGDGGPDDDMVVPGVGTNGVYIPP